MIVAFPGRMHLLFDVIEIINICSAQKILVRMLYSNLCSSQFSYTVHRERSGSVAECLTRDREAAGLSLADVNALLSLSKTHLS